MRAHYLTLTFFSSWVPLVSGAEVDFRRDIQPFFAEHCLECHGADKAKGGLALTSRAGALKALESGLPGIVPGKPGESEILARLETTHGDDKMPPLKKAKRPTAAEVEKVRNWVAEGAPWATHWAYTPVQKPAGLGGSPSEQIDSLVRARLGKEGIAPSREAGKNALLKRVYYDLLGLPPTREEAAAFLTDRAPDAYGRLVERVLASPHFGERWGRHWLDQARYADSDGYEKDSPRPDAWRYRDWVIDAINRDVPLDRFTIEQLAGDLIDNATPEQVLATAFHRQTLTNREGGVDQEQYRVEAVFDRTETTGSVWLAHTVGCARCHSHKYDQISQKEYYQLFAVFNNADESAAKVGTSKAELSAFEQKNAAHLAHVLQRRKAYVEARAPLVAKLPAWEADMQRQLAAVSGKTAETVTLKPLSIKSAQKTQFAELPDGSILAQGKTPETDIYTIDIQVPPGTFSGFRLDVLPDDSLPAKGPGRGNNGNFVITKFSVEADTGGKREALELHSPQASFAQTGFSAAATLDADPNSGWGVLGGTGKAHNLTIQLMQPLVLESPATLTIRIEQAFKKSTANVLGRFRLNLLRGATVESLLTAELKRLVDTGSEKWTVEQKESIVDWLAHFDPVANAARLALLEAEAAGPQPPLMEVRVLSQRRVPRETRVLHRGEFLSPTDAVAAGTPAVLPPLQSRRPETADRLDFARWLVAPENPLTARVLANQIWMRLFGEGIVRTVGDFGVRGEAPTHPELLDLLASQLVESGWSRKALIRAILYSATYRQSSVNRADLAEIDPLNKLLARQNRLRVEGEIVRDLHLAVSGLLSRKIGGPSVFPPMPPEIASLSYAGNFRWAESKGEDRVRRGMYTFFKRTAPHPDLATFDCPDANVTSVRRTVSNTPLQALTTLNAQSFAEAAQALAKRCVQTAEGIEEPDHARVRSLFETCLLRAPESAETDALVGLLHSARETFHAQPVSAQKMGGTPELAAWTAVARVVLNTDEFITRD
jgi:mono/diheme cytochrome c family protein